MPPHILTEVLDLATTNSTSQKVLRTRGGLKANQTLPRLCTRHSQVCHLSRLISGLLLTSVADVALEDSNLEDIRVGHYKDREGNVISMLIHKILVPAMPNFSQLILIGRIQPVREWRGHLTQSDLSTLQLKARPRGDLRISDHVSRRLLSMNDVC